MKTIFLFILVILTFSCIKEHDTIAPEGLSVNYVVSVPKGCKTCNGEGVIYINQERTNIFVSSYFSPHYKEYKSQTMYYTKGTFNFKYELYVDAILDLTVKNNQTNEIKTFHFTQNYPDSTITY